MGACLESESTAATLGQEGVRAFQPMSNHDFVSIPLGRYIRNHLEFAADLGKPPIIFSVNYFIRGADGEYLTGMNAKRVWAKWMERRVHGELTALRTPVGLIPKYEDLRTLFLEVLGEEYAQAQYEEQFTLRVPENLSKLDRMEKLFRADIGDAPNAFFEILAAQRARLHEAQQAGGDYIAPGTFEEE